MSIATTSTPDDFDAQPSIGRLLMLSIVVAGAAFGAVVATQQLERIIPIWPANGAIVACLFCSRPRAWPAYILAGSIAMSAGFFFAGDSIVSSVLLSGINALEVFIAALALWWRTPYQPDLKQFATLLRFIGGSVVVAPAVATILAAFSFLLMGQELASPSSLIHMFLADALGIAIITPFYLTFLSGDARSLLKSKKIASLNWLMFVAFTTGLVFYQTTYPCLFLIPPVLLAATVAQGLPGLALNLIILTTAALWGTTMGHGPFALSLTITLSRKIIFAQLFIFSNFLMASYVAIAAEEKRRILSKLEEDHAELFAAKMILSESESRFRLLSEHSADIVIQVSEASIVEYASPSVEEVLGWKPSEMIGRSAADFTHPDDVALHTRMVEELMRDTPLVTGRVRGLHKNGSYIWLERRTRRVRQADKIAFVSNVRDISPSKKAEEQLEEANEKLSRIALLDSLTGIANRRRLDEALGQEWRRAEREKLPLSFLLLDVDRFKDYNDFYGHQGGDACLHAIAQSVAKAVHRPGDLVARYGGEELAFLLPNTDEKGADIIAENARTAITALSLPHEKNGSCGGIVTASIGVSTFRPNAEGPHRDPAILVRMADMMLYEAKRSGRNKVMSPNKLEANAPFLAKEKEEKRLLAVQKYVEKGRSQTSDLNRIARLAAHLLHAPIGLVSMVGKDNQVFIGRFGLDATETSRDVSFCAYTLDSPDPLIVGNAPTDVRFKDNALVTGDMGIRFYAGAPLISTKQGEHLGALCVIDTSSRDGVDIDQRKILADLAALAVKCIEDGSETDVGVATSKS